MQCREMVATWHSARHQYAMRSVAICCSYLLTHIAFTYLTFFVLWTLFSTETFTHLIFLWLSPVVVKSTTPSNKAYFSRSRAISCVTRERRVILFFISARIIKKYTDSWNQWTQTTIRNFRIHSFAYTSSSFCFLLVMFSSNLCRISP